MKLNILLEGHLSCMLNQQNIKELHLICMVVHNNEDLGHRMDNDPNHD